MSERVCKRCGRPFSSTGRGRPPSYCAECHGAGPAPAPAGKPNGAVALAAARAALTTADTNRLAITAINREAALLAERIADDGWPDEPSPDLAELWATHASRYGYQTVRPPHDGLALPRPLSPRMHITERRARIKLLWNRGFVTREIAAELDVPRPTVAADIRAMRRDGWYLPRRLPVRSGPAGRN